MKKIVTLLMIGLMIFSVACTSQDISSEVKDLETDQTVVEETPPEGQEPPDMTEGLDGMFESYVSDGVLTAEEAEALTVYFEANDPKNGTGVEDPIAGALSEGIINESQASVLSETLSFGPDQGAEGDNDSESREGMISIEEANAIEDALVEAVGYTSAKGGYPIVDTNQTTFYDNDSIIDAPLEGDAFYGQDANYIGTEASYTDNGDGTITDNVTGLMWQQDPGEKLTWTEAVERLETFELAGYDDWRMPTIKELYSLVQFSGITGMSSDSSIPYLDTDYFFFEYGDAAGENRFIDSQMLSSTIYDSDTLGGATTVFGYNFADGRIKGYPITKDFYSYFVRDNTNYGQNQFVDNGDETITDEATGLMWMTFDSGYYEAGSNNDGTMDWQEALAWAEDLELAGYDDWKLPNAKELQSLLDYSKSPETTDSPAIDDLFYCTPIINAFDESDYGFYWTGTTHVDGDEAYAKASYVVFGKGMGVFNSEVVDSHGAGSQRSDPKTGDRDDYPMADLEAPQGDENRVFNMIRAVRVVDSEE